MTESTLESVTKKVSCFHNGISMFCNVLSNHVKLKYLKTFAMNLSFLPVLIPNWNISELTFSGYGNGDEAAAELDYLDSIRDLIHQTPK